MSEPVNGVSKQSECSASVALELAGNLQAEVLAVIPTALLAEIFLLLAENSRNFKPFFMIYKQMSEYISSKFFLYHKQTKLFFPNLTLGAIV